MIDSSNFYKTLRSLKKSYNWTLDDDNSIVAVSGKSVYNPITAIANYFGVKADSNNKKTTLRVARALGLETGFAEQIYNAANCVTNRGQSQIVRGRVRKALGL
jgi:hypothetical protein